MWLVHPAGFEPATFCSEDRRSNPLSYGCVGTPVGEARTKSDRNYAIGFLVRPTGIEPILLVPETSVLSVELRAHGYIIPFLFAK